MDHLAPLRLEHAQRRYRQALNNCPHWDYESDGTTGLPCCVEVAEADHEKELARRAARKRLRN